MTVREVDVSSLSLDRLAPVIGEARTAALHRGAAAARRQLSGRTLWNVNSTATGGGVAEMLQVLVGYAKDTGADVRWAVIEGDPEFFAITKRLHNRIHGATGDAGALGEAEIAAYRRTSERNHPEFTRIVRPGDVVVLHDPQTAGLVEPLLRHGARVIWRCHIGSNTSNEATEEAWRFLRPMVEPAERIVFSRRAYVPDWVPEEKIRIIPPSIDPMSAKNRPLEAAEIDDILRSIGLVRHDTGAEPRAEVVGGPIDDDTPLVVQVSRWDRLKDMSGVMSGFVEHVAKDHDVALALVGPDVSGVSDDPEGLEVYEECVAAWHELDSERRAQVRLITLPMDDVDENAVMVNALQRHASVVVQKSLAEGFGLTVAEGMWKGRPVIGSAVGGIPDQIASGTGVLLQDPQDQAEFGRVLNELLAHPERMEEMGAAAHEHIREHFVGDTHLLRWIELVSELLDDKNA